VDLIEHCNSSFHPSSYSNLKGARLAERVAAGIRTRGYAWVRNPIDDASFSYLASELGEIIDDVTPGGSSQIGQDCPMALHSDHPIATRVAWRCEAQDEGDGRTILIDARAALESLHPDTRARLETIRLPLPSAMGQPPEPTRVVRDGRIYFAPWLRPIDRGERDLQAIGALWRALRRQPPAFEARLTPGQVLLIDNGRMMHARGLLCADSARRLRRLWISAPT
jgi:alpha-ketoglutarate-dependent taurine dioxygenase